MIIKNGLVWEESGSFRKKELVVDTTTHRIAETAEDDTVFDAEGLYVIPGLVDVHIHGARGHDFSDGNSKGLAEIAQYLHSCGVTSFCPTSMTLPEEQLTAAFATINDVPDAAGYAHIAGIHMEGPYLSPEKKGAQKASYLHAPDAAMFRRLSAASGNKIRIITIAPELPGSDAFIREFKDTVAISLGHSTASYEIAENAFAAGANHVTHLFNAMPPLHHRDPGIIGAAADCPHAMAEIICDGIHIHPSVIRNAFRMFGNDRMILISDAMRATGMEDGEYELGGQPVIKKGRLATLKDGTIAGSATNLFDCMKNAVQFGIPLGVARQSRHLQSCKEHRMFTGNRHPCRRGKSRHPAFRSGSEYCKDPVIMLLCSPRLSIQRKTAWFCPSATDIPDASARPSCRRRRHPSGLLPHGQPCSVPVAAHTDASHFLSHAAYTAVRKIPSDLFLLSFQTTCHLRHG